ncbi:hypothetical protein M8J77_022148 [Diaphorina citri]|nr:hypothetical protein M8J77_022148 [Diaphorina citri]
MDTTFEIVAPYNNIIIVIVADIENSSSEISEQQKSGMNAQISSKKSKDIKTAKDLISRPKTVLKSVDSYIEKKHHVLSQLEL